LKPAKVRIKNTTRRRYKPKKPRTRWWKSVYLIYTICLQYHENLSS
jgi:hypothetical protein